MTINDCDLPDAFAAGRHSPTLLTMQAKDPRAFAGNGTDNQHAITHCGTG
jgi:hypothetical protein